MIKWIFLSICFLWSVSSKPAQNNNIAVNIDAGKKYGEQIHLNRVGKFIDELIDEVEHDRKLIEHLEKDVKELKDGLKKKREFKYDKREMSWEDAEEECQG